MEGAIPDRDPAVFDLVTVLYRSAEGLERFLAGLRAQDLPAWRLHVVDNASPDDSAEIVARQADPRIRLIRNARNLGFARAANQGLRAGLAAGGDCLVLINNDTMLAPDFLHRLKAARDAAGAEVFAPRVMQEHDGAVASLIKAMPKQLSGRIAPHDPEHAERELTRWVQEVALKTLHNTDPWKT